MSDDHQPILNYRHTGTHIQAALTITKPNLVARLTCSRPSLIALPAGTQPEARRMQRNDVSVASFANAAY